MNKKIFFVFVVGVIITTSVASAQKLPVIIATSFKKDTFNIKQFGAVADGYTLNTNSINNAIDACNKNGGGVVVVPAGLWITGPIILRSNVTSVYNAVQYFSSLLI